MDKCHYAVLYNYVAHEIYPRDANHFQRRDLQNSSSRFTPGEGNLYMNGRRVLHAGNVTTELMKLHTSGGHMKADALLLSAEKQFVAANMREYCRRVILSCDDCNDDVITKRYSGPMVHPSKVILDNACKRLGLNYKKDRLLTKGYKS